MRSRKFLRSRHLPSGIGLAGIAFLAPESALLSMAVRAVISFGILFVPCALMGATLPLLTRFCTESREVIGARVSLLYALNTLGATAGCFAAGYWLIDTLGLSVTNLAAAGANLIIAAAACALGLGARRSGVASLPARQPDEAARAYLVWSPLFALGDPVIDAQHKILIDYVNRLYELLAEPDCGDAVIALLYSFLDHAARHFQSESRLLQSYQVKGWREHLLEHDQMLRQAKEWVVELDEGKLALKDEQVLNFVREWVVRHILFVDMQLKDELQHGEGLRE